MRPKLTITVALETSHVMKNTMIDLDQNTQKRKKERMYIYIYRERKDGGHRSHSAKTTAIYKRE
jgi:hypothetical protein